MCTFIYIIILLYYRQLIRIRIYDDEEYEKNEVFYIELDEPCLLRKGSGIYHKYLLLWLDALDL